MYRLVCTERDAAIRKNADLSLSLREAKKAMTSMSASSSMAAATPTPASPSTLPPTSLFPSVTAPKAKTPSFALPGSTPMGTPKASSLTKSHGYALPLPPSASGAITHKATNEMDDLCEKLRLAEERSQQHYDEMKEYQSWLQQVEEGQETLKGSNEPEYDPVPDNPPGLWDRKDGKDASVANSDILAKMGKIGSLEFRERSTRGSSSNHGPSVKILMYGGQTLCRQSVLHQEILTLLHGEDGLHQLNYLTPTTLNSLTQVTFASNPSTPSYPLPCRTWWMLRAK